MLLPKTIPLCVIRKSQQPSQHWDVLQRRVRRRGVTWGCQNRCLSSMSRSYLDVKSKSNYSTSLRKYTSQSHNSSQRTQQPDQDIKTSKEQQDIQEEASPNQTETQTQTETKLKSQTHPPRKSQAQLDEDLRLKMAGREGDGGASGVEYEDGKPVAMKRGVRNNMFRYI